MTQTDLTRRRGKAPLVAAGYTGLVAAFALAYGVAGSPEGWGGFLTLVAFPGSTLVVVAFIAAHLLFSSPGEVDLSDETAGPFDPLVQYAGGALVNVLLAWGVFAFVRHFVREARRSRR